MNTPKKSDIYPKITPFRQPKHIRDYPLGPAYGSGQLVEGHASWRTLCPVIDAKKCVGCWLCYLLCPDAAIYKDNDKAAVNTDFCKGCGICAHHCPKQAIQMKNEAEHER